MRLRIFVLGAFCLLMGIASSSASAFNAEGIVSGMAREPLVASAARLGLHSKNRADGTLLLSNPAAPGLEITLGFCGNVLTSYRRNLFSDTDYAAALARLFSEYGPPRAVSFRGDIVTNRDSGSGVMQSYVVTQWQHGDDRVALRSYFDWRIQQGNLGRFQPATLFYERRNPCATR